jgi:molecular chaperone HtpG
VEGIVPEFLTLLHGVIDSPDIPLNVSRSYLQSDGNVKKISNHILKKVADKLEELFKENRSDFEAKWDDIGVFIKYGMLSEEKFFDRARKFCLLKNVDGKYFTIDEYRELIRLNQEDKDKKLVHVYANRPEEQQVFVDAAKAKGYDILSMDGVLDAHFVNFLEQKLEQVAFVRVDADTADNLVRKDEQRVSVLDQTSQDELKQLTESHVDKARFDVSLQALSADDAPVLVTRPEFMRRMKEMSAMGGGMGFMGEMPEHYQLVVNSNHPLMRKVLDTTDAESRGMKLRQAIDLALLTQGLLKGEELSRFLKRSVSLLES